MSQTIGLIRCGIGDEAYCFEMSSVVEVRQGATMRVAPHAAPGEPIGWLTAAGDNRLPIFRLADRLGRTVIADDARRQHIVVVHSSLGDEGFLVDAVSRVIAVPSEQVRGVPTLVHDPRRRWFKSVVLFPETGPDSMCLVLSAERLHRHALALPCENLSDHLVDRVSADVVATTDKPVRPLSSGRIVLFPLPGSAAPEGDVLCGFSAAQVVEIVEPLPILPVPLAPPQVAGIVRWRERVLPVLRFHEWLGLPPDVPTRRLVILQHAGEPFALPTSQILRARRFPLLHRPCSPPSGFNRDAMWGAFRMESEVLVVPNLARLTRPQS